MIHPTISLVSIARAAPGPEQAKAGWEATQKDAAAVGRTSWPRIVTLQA
jgi:hypothetical protein